jgi:hypothetical protein
VSARRRAGTVGRETDDSTGDGRPTRRAIGGRRGSRLTCHCTLPLASPCASRSARSSGVLSTMRQPILRAAESRICTLPLFLRLRWTSYSMWNWSSGERRRDRHRATCLRFPRGAALRLGPHPYGTSLQPGDGHDAGPGGHGRSILAAAVASPTLAAQLEPPWGVPTMGWCLPPCLPQHASDTRPSVREPDRGRMAATEDVGRGRPIP